MLRHLVGVSSTLVQTQVMGSMKVAMMDVDQGLIQGHRCGKNVIQFWEANDVSATQIEAFK